MCRLIVAVLLASCLTTILRIVHKSCKTSICCILCIVNSEVLAVRSSYNKFFTPVAHDICCKTRVVLWTIVCSTSVSCKKSVKLAAVCKVVNLCTVEDFTLKVAVPVNHEVLSRLSCRNCLTCAVENIIVCSTPEFSTGILWIDITAASTSCILWMVLVEDILTCLSVYERYAPRLFFVTHPKLKSLSVGEEITKVHSVTVSLSVTPEKLSVVVDTSWTE